MNHHFSKQDDLGRIRCPICDLQYLSKCPEDRRVHKVRCKRIQQMTRFLGHQLPRHEEREEIKAGAHRVLNKSTHRQDRLTAQHQLIWAHFARSCMRYNPMPGGRQHPKLDDYISRYPRTHIRKDLIFYFDAIYGQAKIMVDSFKGCCYLGEE